MTKFRLGYVDGIGAIDCERLSRGGWDFFVRFSYYCYHAPSVDEMIEIAKVEWPGIRFD